MYHKPAFFSIETGRNVLQIGGDIFRINGNPTGRREHPPPSALQDMIQSAVFTLYDFTNGVYWQSFMALGTAMFRKKFSLDAQFRWIVVVERSRPIRAHARVEYVISHICSRRPVGL